MKATILKILPLKESRNGDVAYQRVQMELEDKSFAMTDLVTSFRNYARWRPIVQAGEGTVIEGIVLKEKGKVDADSPVRIYSMPGEIIIE